MQYTITLNEIEERQKNMKLDDGLMMVRVMPNDDQEFSYTQVSINYLVKEILENEAEFYILNSVISDTVKKDNTHYFYITSSVLPMLFHMVPSAFDKVVLTGEYKDGAENE